MEHWPALAQKMNALFLESDRLMARKLVSEARRLNDDAQAMKSKLLAEGAPLAWDKRGMASLSQDSEGGE